MYARIFFVFLLLAPTKCMLPAAAALSAARSKLERSVKHAFDKDFKLDPRVHYIKKNGLFYNSQADSEHNHFADALNILKATLNPFAPSYTKPFWPYFNGNPDSLVTKSPVLDSSEQLSLQWLGHASLLIQAQGFNLLTDPLFGNLAPVLYPRRTKVGVAPEQLPRIDFVLISHNHHDHLDPASLKKLLPKQPFILVPLGLKSWIESLGFTHVYESDWWQEYQFKRNDKEISITCVPAEHWSKRTAFDAQKTLWSGWVIKTGGQTAYFSGDTAWAPEKFAAIKAYAGHIDVALLQAGPCEPRQYMQGSHIGSEEAMQAWKILDADLNIPIHWGTFRLGPDPLYLPIHNLLEIKDQLPRGRLRVMNFGERIDVAHEAALKS